MSSNDLPLRVTVQPVPFDATEGEKGRPQVNPRLYLTLANTERLQRQGWTEKQIRRRAFAKLRKMLGLEPETVIAKATDGDYFMVKTRALDSNLVVVVTPDPSVREEQTATAA